MQVHQHMFCARLDMAVDDAEGGKGLSVSEVRALRESVVFFPTDSQIQVKAKVNTTSTVRRLAWERRGSSKASASARCGMPAWPTITLQGTLDDCKGGLGPVIYHDQGASCACFLCFSTGRRSGQLSVTEECAANQMHCAHRWRVPGTLVLMEATAQLPEPLPSTP